MVDLSAYPSGIQYLRLRVAHSLSKIVSVNNNGQPVNFGNIVFKLGDLNDDNSISTAEGQFVIDRIGIASEDPEWDQFFSMSGSQVLGSQADLNRDGLVNIHDVNLITPWIGQSGE